MVNGSKRREAIITMIQIDPPLRCGHIVPTVAGTASPCGKPAVHGMISPLNSEAWEMIPLCDEHYADLQKPDATE